MYREFYKLQEMPFQLTPDPRFLFRSRSHSKALSYLNYGIQAGEGFVIITGSAGVGKTVLTMGLVDSLPKNSILTAHLVTSQLDPTQFFQMVASSFGLPYENESKTTLLNRLHTYISARAQEGKKILLVIDEAHMLPIETIEEIRMLSNFQIGGKSFLQGVLIGQTQLQSTLLAGNVSQFLQRVIAAHHLTPLDENETENYIRYRLNLVGWADNPRFTKDAFSAIHRYSKGVPRDINLICNRLLLHGCMEELHEFGEDLVNVSCEERKNELTIMPSVDKNTVTEGIDIDYTQAGRPNTFTDEILSRYNKDTKHTTSKIEHRLNLLERRLTEIESILKERKAG